MNDWLTNNRGSWGMGETVAIIKIALLNKSHVNIINISGEFDLDMGKREIIGLRQCPRNVGI
jgi:hypothetical protein